MSVDAHNADLQRRARRSAGRKLGFFIHATVYLLVNALLVGIDLRSGRGGQWSIFPLLGWGIGLAMHGLIAFGPVERLYRRLVEREVERLRQQR